MIGDNIVSAGREAWRAYREAEEHTLDRLLAVGAALLVGRREALAASGAAGPFTLPYRKAFAAWCEGNGFGDVPSPWRSDLLWIAESEAEVRAFYARKAGGQKRGKPSLQPHSLRGRIERERREGGPRPKRKNPLVGSVKAATLARLIEERLAHKAPADAMEEIAMLAAALERAAMAASRGSDG